MEKIERLRKKLCIIFAFLISISLFATLITTAFRFTLFDKDFFVGELEKSGYSQIVYEKVVEELSSNGYVSGFDEEFFLQAIDVEDVKTPILSLVDRIYGTGEYQ